MNAKNITVVQEYIPHPVTKNYYYDSETKTIREINGPFHVCPFVFGEVTALGVRLGINADQIGPLVSPDDGSCSINLLGLR